MTDKLTDKEINDLLEAVSKEEYRDKKDYSVLEGMERDSVSKIKTAFDKGYKQGYEATEANEKQAYQEGLDKAWDTMRKILNGFSFYETEVFKTKYYPDIIKKYSASEAIGKIEAFEAKQRRMKENDCEHCSKEYGTLGCCSTVNNEWIYSCEEGHKEYRQRTEINVGDEVYLIDECHPRVVTCITKINGENPAAVQFTKSGKWVVDNVTELHKTGRHFDQIEEVLKALGEGHNDRDR